MVFDSHIPQMAVSEWERLRGDGKTVSSTLASEFFGNKELAPHLYLVRVRRQDARQSVIRCGSVLGDLCGMPVEGKVLTECLPREVSVEWQTSLVTVVNVKLPIAQSGFIDLMNGQGLSFRQVLLPLGKAASDDLVLGVVSYCIGPLKSCIQMRPC